MRDDAPFMRDDANDCDAAACEGCGLHSTSVGLVNDRLICGGCFDREAEALHERMTRDAKKKKSKRAPKPKRPLDCPHWDYEDPDPDCACVGGHS